MSQDAHHTDPDETEVITSAAEPAPHAAGAPGPPPAAAPQASAPHAPAPPGYAGPGWPGPAGGPHRRHRRRELALVGIIGLVLGCLVGAGVTAVGAFVIHRHESAVDGPAGYGWHMRNGGGMMKRAPGQPQGKFGQNPWNNPGPGYNNGGVPAAPTSPLPAAPAPGAS